MRGVVAGWVAGATVLAVATAVLPGSAHAEDAPRAGAGAESSTASPVTTLLRSAAFPGWGQLENRQSLKAVLVFGAETGLLASGFVELKRAERSLEAQERAADRGDAAGAAEEYQRYLDRRDRGISRFWWAGFALLLSMLDAYTDAHLRDFHTGAELPGPEAMPRPGPSAPAAPAAPDTPAAPDEKRPAPPDGVDLGTSPSAALLVDVHSRRVGIAFTF
jgi:hypothetical protein